jgi:threonine dehydratase
MISEPPVVRPASARSPEDGPRSGGGRLAWPDVAKGACILLVVLWHVVLKQYQQIDWDLPLPIAGAWGLADDQLTPLRMPVFFTVSGLFAVRAVDRPWPVLLRSRIARFALLYVLWVLIETVVLGCTPAFPTEHAADPLQLLAELTISPTNLWYLLALALYFAVAKAVRRVPTAWLLGAAFLLSAVAAAHIIPDAGNRWQVLQNLLFFLAGLRLAPALQRLALGATRRRLLLLTLATSCALAAVDLLHAKAWLGVWPAVSALAALTGITAAAVLTERLPRAAGRLAALGRRTLPVYVLHLPLLALLAAQVQGPLQRLGSRSVGVAAVEPLLATSVVVALSLVVHRLLAAAGLGRLFDPLRPRKRTRRGRAADRTSYEPSSSATRAENAAGSPERDSLTMAVQSSTITSIAPVARPSSEARATSRGSIIGPS